MQKMHPFFAKYVIKRSFLLTVLTSFEADFRVIFGITADEISTVRLRTRFCDTEVETVAEFEEVCGLDLTKNSSGSNRRGERMQVRRPRRLPFACRASFNVRLQIIAAINFVDQKPEEMVVIQH